MRQVWLQHLPTPTSLSVSICKMGLVAIIRFKLDDVGEDTSCGP